ncbi:MAG: membrane protein insertion efficiency factor YidD [Legionellales bacterium]|nr:membrane protein insertion efficiency factor YidD [Legionellales bacterium]|tara:strand:+ start:2556 stop:2786 length:231 start_codon:yes stop_codon:yes gene_type:complete
MKQVLILLVSLYQRYISPYRNSCCRFYPTCSQYTIEALSEYGASKGLLLGFWRIWRCHPFHKGGYDPVPQKIIKNS